MHCVNLLLLYSTLLCVNYILVFFFSSSVSSKMMLAFVVALSLSTYKYIYEILYRLLHYYAHPLNERVYVIKMMKCVTCILLYRVHNAVCSLPVYRFRCHSSFPEGCRAVYSFCWQFVNGVKRPFLFV